MISRPINPIPIPKLMPQSPVPLLPLRLNSSPFLRFRRTQHPRPAIRARRNGAVEIAASGLGFFGGGLAVLDGELALFALGRGGVVVEVLAVVASEGAVADAAA